MEASDATIGQIVLRDVHVRYGTAGERAESAPSAADDPALDATFDAAVDPGAPEALAGVSLAINAGEHVCILGANGSGKSTLVQLINGLICASEGSVEVFGLNAGDPASAAAIRRRAAMVFQHPEDQMVTSIVADDVAFGPENLGVPSAEIAARVNAALTAVDMSEHAQADPADLSGGQQQRVAIAGALAMEPEVLLLDEPAAMLDDAGRRAIRDIVRRLNARDITIVHVTHFMDDALAAGRVIVLEQGRIALDGTPAEVFQHRETVHRLGLELPFAEELAWTLERNLPALGPLPRETDAAALAQELAGRIGHHAESQPAGPAGAHAPDRTAPSAQAPAIAFRNVSFSYVDERSAHKRHLLRRGLDRRRRAGSALAVEDLTFDVPRGSLTALVGCTGAGKSTTVELACALKLPRTGSVELMGIATDDLSRRRELRAQVGYVSQLPDRQLFAETVFDDIAFGPRNLGLTEEEVRERVEEALALVGLSATPEMLRRSPFALSGGQQRSVALAGVLALRTPILILDEPMAGLDPQGRSRMHTLIRRLRADGVTILMVTHSMDDVAELADRVIVLAHGRVAALGSPRDVFCPPHSPAPGLPAALAFARRLGQAGAPLPYEPLTRAELVAEIGGLIRPHTAEATPSEEVSHGTAR